MTKIHIHIAAGIILNSDRRKVYITQRPAKAHKGGLWEFAGGKVESGETAEQAVYRELHEEVGIDVIKAESFISLTYDYTDKLLAFDFFLITEFDGEPFGKEGQPGHWVQISMLSDFAFPEANKAVLEKLEKWNLGARDEEEQGRGTRI